MPVQRFRDLDTARRALWVSPSDPSLPDQIAALWQASVEMAQYTPVRGVQKFRSTDEAWADRRARTITRMRDIAREYGFLDGSSY